MSRGGPGSGAMPPTGADVARWAAGRLRYVDNLKVILVATVIAGHAIIGYSEFDWWSYSDVRETTLAPATMIVLIALATPFALLVIPLLFLIAGLLTPQSVERKGVGRFATDRLLRLGVPFVVFALVMWPWLEYALFRWFGIAPELGEYLRVEGSLDTGVLWFVGALLAFSLAYAGWRAIRPRDGAAPRRTRDIRFAHLIALAAVVALATFAVRLVIPAETDNPIVDLNLWEWPACAALFGLGVVASRQGWLDAVPQSLARASRTATLVTVAAAAVFALALVLLRVDADELWGGWHWAALVFAAGETSLSVFGPVWLLAVAQRRLERSLRWIGPAAIRGAYGAFLLQGPVLIGLALLTRLIPAPAEVKALIVATAGVLASFGLAWVLVARVPGVGRVL